LGPFPDADLGFALGGFGTFAGTRANAKIAPIPLDVV